MCPRTLLIHLRLATINVASHTQVLEEYLREYFPAGQLSSINLDFDLGTDERLANWPSRVAAALTALPTSTFRHVVVTITNHTDHDTGDLFLGRDESGMVHAASVDEVSERVFRKKF